MAALETSLIHNGSSVIASANYVIIGAADKAVACINCTWTSSAASFVLKLQYSFDGTNYIDDGQPYSIASNSSSKTWTPSYAAPYYRVNSTRISGTLLTLTVHAVYKPF